MGREIKQNNLFVKGIIVDTNDPLSQARVKVRIPCYHGADGDDNCTQDENLPWAQTCLQTDGALSEGSTVWISFEGGDTRFPVVFGQLGSTASFSVDGEGGDSSGSFGITGGEYDITIDGVTYHVGGSTLAEMGVSLIKIHESGAAAYQAINGYDVNGPSIGLIQWHNENAIGLLKKIREKNQSKYDQLASGASSLISDLSSGTTWYGNHITEGSSVYSALKDILGSDESAEAQDELAAEFVQTYIDLGINAGITDNGALLYHADICNQGPYMAVCKSMRSASDKSLDNFYNLSKNSYYERRTLSYKIIKELQNLGALEGTGGNLENAGGSDSSDFVSILADTMKEFQSKYKSKKWDYLQGTIREYSIRGKSIKTHTDCSGYVSAALMVLNQESGGSYAKELANGAWSSSNFMSSKITGFDKIKYNGYKKLKAGDIVVRSGHVQAVESSDGSGNVKMYNCGDIGMLGQSQPLNWYNMDKGDTAFSYIFRIKASEGSSGGTETGWTWPVPSCKSISSPFGYRSFNGGEFHKGIDIPGAGGSAIIAARSGTVEVAAFSGRAYKNGAYVCGGTGYGNCTVIRHENGYYTLYGHQSSMSVKAGQKVSAGQTIGAVGNTGASFGNHLHFEVRTPDGEPHDPQKYVSFNSKAKKTGKKKTSGSKTKSGSKNGKKQISGSFTATYYGNYKSGSGTKGGSGRVLKTQYSVAVDVSNASKFSSGKDIYGLYKENKEIYIECSECPEINGTYRIDDAGAGGNNVDIYFVSYSNVPKSFKNKGRVSIKVYV